MNFICNLPPCTRDVLEIFLESLSRVGAELSSVSFSDSNPTQSKWLRLRFRYSDSLIENLNEREIEHSLNKKIGEVHIDLSVEELNKLVD